VININIPPTISIVLAIFELISPAFKTFPDHEGLKKFTKFNIVIDKKHSIHGGSPYASMAFQHSSSLHLQNFTLLNQS